VYAYASLAADGCELTCDRFWSVCVTLHGQKWTTLFNQFFTKLTQLKKLTFFHTRGHLPDYQRSICPNNYCPKEVFVFGGSRIILDDTRSSQVTLGFFF